MKNNFFDKYSREICGIPLYAIISSLVIFTAMSLVFFAGDFLIEILGTEYHNVKIPLIDDLVPYRPIMYIPYGLAYVFWIIGMMVVAKAGVHHYTNFITAVSISYIVGMVIIIAFPTSLDRVAEGVYGSSTNGILDDLAKIFYMNDGGRMGLKLFPSFHCLSSILCYLGVRGRPEISLAFRGFAFIATVIICASTLYCKQHYFADVPGGILLGIICYAVTFKFNLGRRIFSI